MSVRSPIFALEHRVSLVDELLAAQSRLGPAVNRFSDWHSEHSREPLQARYYRDLIPLSKPRQGEQFAFEVNLDRCTGCKACVTACHSLNGLDHDESWRDVGLLVGEKDGGYVQTITAACHHCTDPACANGCPVLAYEKDEETGIVRHLDDQCIGCSYCILKCPYDVPKFNAKRGIVRKCDMCHDRLAVGEAPACVQACPTGAIAIRIVKIDATPARGRMVPGAFDSAYTGPTTRYCTTSNKTALGRPADRDRVQLDPAHLPLALMLVLTQMATGAFLGGTVLAWWRPTAVAESALAALYATAAIVGLTGLALSVLHLGQPLKAWRIFLGWRKSWLSREAMVLGAFAGAALTAAITALVAPRSPTPALLAGAAAAALGAAGVFASAMVYIDTRRPFWSATLVLGKFGGTTFLLGASLVAAVWSWAAVPAATAAVFSAWAFQLGLAGWEMMANRRALRDPDSPWHRSALTMVLLQRRFVQGRRILLVLTGGLLPVAVLLFPAYAAPLLIGSLLCATASQLTERHQFFTACAAPKMPGNP